MRLRVTAALAAAILCLAPATSRAALSNYIQNFEGLFMADPDALSRDGWLVYGNVFTPARLYIYGYGPFPAPNGGNAFSAVDAGQGGVEQGAQQLSVYNDYNNTGHALGQWIESNVYREMTVTAADVGTTWIFEFDAKLGNLVPPSTAIAFIKTLDPSAGYALTNFLTADMTGIPVSWGHYSLSITIDAGLVNQLLQIGFASTTTSYVASSVYYDNLVFHNAISTAVETTSNPARAGLASSVAPNPLNPAGLLSFVTTQAGTVRATLFDSSGRLVRTLFETRALPAGRHEVRLDGRGPNGAMLPSGVYFYAVETSEGTVRGKISILK
ncbi:MAG TPA: FlgD immunoglobulin-like domain containing protein [Acidobacteriota bacterium]|nr:FlgD immunoglobulin-like domain containing protein [Acidobacteriota bacterium]